MCLQIPLSCIAILGAERQQILSASGVASSQPYTDRKVSFCAWLLVPEQPELLIVEDMMADSRSAAYNIDNDNDNNNNNAVMIKRH